MLRMKKTGKDTLNKNNETIKAKIRITYDKMDLTMDTIMNGKVQPTEQQVLHQDYQRAKNKWEKLTCDLLNKHMSS